LYWQWYEVREWVERCSETEQVRIFIAIECVADCGDDEETQGKLKVIEDQIISRVRSNIVIANFNAEVLPCGLEKISHLSEDEKEKYLLERKGDILFEGNYQATKNKVISSTNKVISSTFEVSSYYSPPVPENGDTYEGAIEKLMERVPVEGQNEKEAIEAFVNLVTYRVAFYAGMTQHETGRDDKGAIDFFNQAFILADWQTIGHDKAMVGTRLTATQDNATDLLLMFLADTYERVGLEAKEFLPYLDLALQINPALKMEENLVIAALEEHLKRGDIEKARNVLYQVLGSQGLPIDQSNYYRGRISHLTGDLEEAADLYKKAIEKGGADPKRGKVYREWLGRACQDTAYQLMYEPDQADEMIDVLRKAKEAHEKSQERSGTLYVSELGYGRGDACLKMYLSGEEDGWDCVSSSYKQGIGAPETREDVKARFIYPGMHHSLTQPLTITVALLNAGRHKGGTLITDDLAYQVALFEGYSECKGEPVESNWLTPDGYVHTVALDRELLRGELVIQEGKPAACKLYTLCMFAQDDYERVHPLADPYKVFVFSRDVEFWRQKREEAGPEYHVDEPFALPITAGADVGNWIAPVGLAPDSPIEIVAAIRKSASFDSFEVKLTYDGQLGVFTGSRDDIRLEPDSRYSVKIIVNYRGEQVWGGEPHNATFETFPLVSEPEPPTFTLVQIQTDDARTYNAADGGEELAPLRKCQLLLLRRVAEVGRAELQLLGPGRNTMWTSIENYTDWKRLTRDEMKAMVTLAICRHDDVLYATKHRDEETLSLGGCHSSCAVFDVLEQEVEKLYVYGKVRGAEREGWVRIEDMEVYDLKEVDLEWEP